MCANSTSRCASSSASDVLHALGPPAMPRGGGAAFLTAATAHGGAAAAAGGAAAGGAAAGGDGVSAREMHVLRVKLRELEARHATREAEAAELAERTKRLAMLEADKAKRELAAVLESKNAEVDAFRCELDAIVLDIKLMHARQAEAAAFAARKPRRPHGPAPPALPLQV